MSVKPIRLYTDKILYQPTELITEFTGMGDLAADMVETMLEYRGVGLAAPQIGVGKNLAVLYLENKTKIIVVANIIIKGYTKETGIMKEGCLSCPGVNMAVRRYLGVDIEAYNLFGEKVEYRLTEYDARILQHEYDHLQGKLIINNLISL